jgi:hypothetical protein
MVDRRVIRLYGRANEKGVEHTGAKLKKPSAARLPPESSTSPKPRLDGVKG